jgi:hypothetical protein
MLLTLAVIECHLTEAGQKLSRISTLNTEKGLARSYAA